MVVALGVPALPLKRFEYFLGEGSHPSGVLVLVVLEKIAFILSPGKNIETTHHTKAKTKKAIATLRKNDRRYRSASILIEKVAYFRYKFLLPTSPFQRFVPIAANL